jgi:uncharacterized repeat protein (TIGR01451 family)
MVRNGHLRFALLIGLAAALLTVPVRSAPGPFGKLTPTNNAAGVTLTPTLSWEDSPDAARYEYCYDTTNDTACQGTWIPSGTVSLPPNDLAYNTTYYWQVRAIDAENTTTYADNGVWWSFTTQTAALTVAKAVTAQSATPIALGTVLTYTVTATNAGDVTLSDVFISDPLLTPATENCGALAPGAACALSGFYVVQEADFMAGEIVNTATVTFRDPYGAPLGPEIATVTVPLSAAPPAANPDTSANHPIGQAVTVDVLANDIRGDLPLAPTSVVIVAPPAGSTLSPDGKLLIVPVEGIWMVNETTGALTFVPDDNLSGNPTPITYRVDDVRGNRSNAATVTVTYTTPPVANDDASLGNPAGQPVTVNVLANDTAAPGRTLAPASVWIAGATNPGDSLAVAGEGVWAVDIITGALTFAPEEGFTGNPTPAAYTVADDQGNRSNAATVTVTYTVPPVANDDASLGNPAGQPVTVNVLANDVAASGRALAPASVQIAGATNPGGSLAVAGEGVWAVDSITGALTFAPEEGFTGNPTPAAYTVADDQGNRSNAATVTVTYTVPPVANDDASLDNPAGQPVTVNVLANDTAAPGRTLAPASVWIAGATNPGDSLTVAGEGVWAVDSITGALTFAPEEGFTGNPTPAAYTVADDQGNRSNAATVTVTYTVPPVANDDASLGNPAGQPVTVNVLANDTAAPGRTLDPASVWIAGATNAGGSLAVAGEGVWAVDIITGALTFAPEEGFTGNPTPAAYTVADDQGNRSNAATVTITYIVPPVANDDASLGNPAGQPVTVNVLANDTAAPGRTLDPASVWIAGATNPGDSLAVAGEGVWAVDIITGALTFAPEEGFTGNPTPAAYTVADDQGNRSNAATVTVTYTVPPVANDDASLGNPAGQPVTVNVLANDTAAPGRTLAPASVWIAGADAGSGGKTLTVPGEGVWTVGLVNGHITFTPETGFENNPAPVTYTVADDQGNTSTPATLTVTYTDNPLARNDVSPGNPIGSAVTVDVLDNDVAAPGRTLAPASVWIAGATNAGGSLAVAGEGAWAVDSITGALTFAPEEGFTGNPTPAAYTVADDQGNRSNAATVTVTYTVPPVANDDASLDNPAGQPVTVNVLANDTAAPGRTLAPASVWIAGATNAGGSLAVAGEGVWAVDSITGALTFAPEEGFTGNPTPAAYTVADDQSNRSNAATVTVTYTVPPVANDDASLDNPAGQPVTVNVLANDTAAPGRTLAPASVWIAGATNPGDSLAVAGEGVWAVDIITGALTFAPEEGFTGNPTPAAYTVADDQGNRSNAATVTVTYIYTTKDFAVYLPLVMRSWPPIPGVPALHSIANPHGYDAYTITWDAAALAEFYVLQESQNGSFNDAVEVYSGTHISLSFSGKGPTRYHYRVQARNSYGSGGWSNVRPVDVLWEKEPNDSAPTEANGPLISGLTYYGRFPSSTDRQDYFFIYLQSAQRVELWLTNIAAGQDYDLTMRNASLQVVAHSGELGNANERIRTATLPAGFYYIQVYNRSSSGSAQAYHLQVIYPATVLSATEAGALPIPARTTFDSTPAPHVPAGGSHPARRLRPADRTSDGQGASH